MHWKWCCPFVFLLVVWVPHFYQSCAFWERCLFIYKWCPKLCLWFRCHYSFHDFARIMDGAIVWGLFTVFTQIIPCSPKIIMNHCGLTESYRSDFIWRRMLVGWRNSLVSALHHCMFSLCPFLGSQQGLSGWPTWWNPPQGNITKKCPQFFSPRWCLLVVGAQSYLLAWRTVWLCPLLSCFIGWVCPGNPERLRFGTCGGLPWHTWAWKRPRFCLYSPN